MSGIATAIIGSAVVTSYASSKAAGKAAEATTEAAQLGTEAQERASMLAIEEQRRQFDKTLEVLQPYVTAGNIQLEGFAPYQAAGREQIGAIQEFAAVGPEALRQQRALAGLAGPEAEAAALRRIEESPTFQALARQGEEALLQRASATGGLRGGNVQAALAQFRPSLLNQLVEQQYGRLGGLTAVGGGASGALFESGLGTSELLSRLGQASAAGQAAGATTLGTNVANLLSQAGRAQAAGAQTIGAAQAAQALAQGQAISNLGASIPNALLLSRFMPTTPTAPSLILGGG